MNHFAMLLILSLAIATVFTLVTKQTRPGQIRYFLKMLLYMVIGSLVGGWVMSAIPW